jgi:excisionase family DNA binding protein
MNTKNNNVNQYIEPLLTELRASELLNVSYNNLRMWIRPSGKISFIRVGKNGIRYTPSDIKKYVKANRVESKKK